MLTITLLSSTGIPQCSSIKTFPSQVCDTRRICRFTDHLSITLHNPSHFIAINATTKLVQFTGEIDLVKSELSVLSACAQYLRGIDKGWKINRDGIENKSSGSTRWRLKTFRSFSFLQLYPCTCLPSSLYQKCHLFDDVASKLSLDYSHMYADENTVDWRRSNSEFFFLPSMPLTLCSIDIGQDYDHTS
jgi:hypothetical protein